MCESVHNNSGSLQTEFRNGAGHTQNYYVLTVPGQLPNWWENLIQKIAKTTLQLRKNSVIVEREQPIFNFDWAEVELSKFSDAGVA